MIECPLLRKIWEEALEDLYYDPVMNFEALRILKEIEEKERRNTEPSKGWTALCRCHNLKN